MSLITKKNHRKYVASLCSGFLGGNIASLVKFGTEVPFPPRTPDRASPPIELLQDLGIQAQNWVYSYSNHVINFAACGFHHLFSIFFAMLCIYRRNLSKNKTMARCSFRYCYYNCISWYCSSYI